MSETFHYFVTIGRPNATRTLTLVWNFRPRPRKRLENRHYLKLRVVQIQANLFLKSKSERGGSDKERL